MTDIKLKTHFTHKVIVAMPDSPAGVPIRCDGHAYTSPSGKVVKISL